MEGFEGPIYALGGPASPTMESHPERGQRQGVLHSGGWGRPAGERLGPGIWPLGCGIAAIQDFGS